MYVCGCVYSWALSGAGDMPGWLLNIYASMHIYIFAFTCMRLNTYIAVSICMYSCFLWLFFSCACTGALSGTDWHAALVVYIYYVFMYVNTYACERLSVRECKWEYGSVCERERERACAGWVWVRVCLRAHTCMNVCVWI